MLKTCLGTVLGILIAVGILFGGCMFFAAGVITHIPKDLDATSTTKSATPANGVITKAHFESIQEGMSYEDAVKIIGRAGEENASSTMPGVRGVMPSVQIKMYSWINPDGSNMNASFQNDRLTTKAQFGLK
jgi:hypothetical protein